MPYLPYIAVDFDHTIVDHDLPLPGAIEGLQKLRDMGYRIVIHSCNKRDWIERVLNTHDIPYDLIWDEGMKPICYAYIDDRGVGFNGNWNDAVEEVKNIGNRRARILGTYERNAKTEAGTE